MLIAALLFYRKFKKDLEGIRFIFNPYDPCVANRIISSKQQTVRFHIDDLMSSHVDKKVNDKFLIWLNDKYGEHGDFTATRGDTHDYLGMIFKFSNGEVKISMVDYIRNVLKEFPLKFKKGDRAVNPVASDMFKQDNSKKLSKEQAEIFHCTVAKALY